VVAGGASDSGEVASVGSSASLRHLGVIVELELNDVSRARQGYSKDMASRNKTGVKRAEGNGQPERSWKANGQSTRLGKTMRRWSSDGRWRARMPRALRGISGARENWHAAPESKAEVRIRN